MQKPITLFLLLWLTISQHNTASAQWIEHVLPMGPYQYSVNWTLAQGDHLLLKANHLQTGQSGYIRGNDSTLPIQWEPLPNDSIKNISSIHATPSMLLCGDDGFLRISIDEGATWKKVPDPGLMGSAYISIGNIIIAHAISGRLYSTDLGDTWLPLVPFIALPSMVSDGSTLLHVDYNLHLLKSTATDPLNFQVISTDVPGPLGKLFLPRPELLFKVGSTDISRYDGTKWEAGVLNASTPVVPPTAPIGANSMIADSNELYMTTAHGAYRIYRSIDDGLNWNQIDIGLGTETINQQKVFRTRNRLYILSSLSNGIYKLHSKPVGTSSASAIAAPQIQATIAPNPGIMSDLRVQLLSSQPLGSGTVQVFDMGGALGCSTAIRTVTKSFCSADMAWRGWSAYGAYHNANWYGS
jgi:hypothetical protein